MVVVRKKDKNRDRGVAAGANLGLIATVVVAVRGWFKERKHQRELARRKRDRKAKRVRFALKAVRIATYFVPIVIALAKAAGLIAKRREKKLDKEAEDVGIEIIHSEPVSSEEEVYERVNSENSETEE
ncbi:MAG: hypothetical protein LUE20_06735 [Oscillospiraceae bacterium]|nr:hypothetical protein [Oscillospiraceae bacterium]